MPKPVLPKNPPVLALPPHPQLGVLSHNPALGVARKPPPTFGVAGHRGSNPLLFIYKLVFEVFFLKKNK
jgi:hypothetical protein